MDTFENENWIFFCLRSVVSGHPMYNNWLLAMKFVRHLMRIQAHPPTHKMEFFLSVTWQLAKVASVRPEQTSGKCSLGYNDANTSGYRWFSPWRHQILKSKSRDLLNFYLLQVEDELEINLFISFKSRGVFRLENAAFWISEFSPCVTPR